MVHGLGLCYVQEAVFFYSVKLENGHLVWHSRDLQHLFQFMLPYTAAVMFQFFPCLPNPSQDEKEPEYVQDELIATSADGYIEVYISAMESPSSFWVQLVGSQSINLDKLVEDMTNYYSHLPNQQSHALTSAAVGDIVASRFAQDSCWYRARIVTIEENDYSQDETTIKVHYVDFGETGRYKTKELCTLDDEYRYLPLQAIECSLAGVQPRDGTQWTEEASDLFEMLSHAAQWKVMMAKVVSKAKREDGFPGFKYSVELVDTNNKDDVSVAAELISQGHAVQAV